MSNINIKRAIENIRTSTTIYTPVVEIIVNAIQAIEESGRSDGKVSVRVMRSIQTEVDGSLPDITGFEVEDNGVGFTDKHRNSFDTLYTDHRIDEGGKGFGRFICLKYFNALHVKSTYMEGHIYKCRSFQMGKEHDIIIKENIAESEKKDTHTIITLTSLKKGPTFEKKLNTIARNLVERLLPYFIAEDYTCPQIVLSESNNNGDQVCLNDFVNTAISRDIREIPLEKTSFILNAHQDKEEFHVRVFKLYAPGNQKSRISLVAHKREVSGSMLHKYISEFEDEFYDKDNNGMDDHDRNYIIKAYVFSSYLDRNVSLERGGFEFAMETEALLGISQSMIEELTAKIAREAVGNDITLRMEKKKTRVQSYVDEQAPWHKDMLHEIDLSEIPYKPTDMEIESCLQKKKFVRETTIKRDVENILSKQSFENIEDTVVEIISKISDNSKNDLVRYIALRRKILDIFKKSLEVDESGKYSSEGIVHDIIFPRKGDTESTPLYEHNLWIVDERLNFTNYVSSDAPLNNAKNSGRPDLLVYNRRVLFRGDNETSNPITIFEFKKPQRDDFTDPSSKDDPVEQIIRYVNEIQDGKHKTPEGRDIKVVENTPFYGFVVCDLTLKVETWLKRTKDFKPMPDRLGWFQWMSNINLYIEVISWDKLLNDAQMRNKIFFKKLGI